MNSVERILDFADRARFEDLPSDARQSAAVFLADAIGVGISGSREDSAERVFTTVSSWGTGDVASVLGRPGRLPATGAAYVNSFQVHCQEFDPLHEPATVHAMAVLTGALLAVAERHDLAGRDLLLGTAIGVEISVMLGLAAQTGLRFFRPATAGALGTTVALTRLAGLDRETTRNALGITYSQLAGTMQAHVEGSVSLPLQIAHGARAAVSAIDLAAAGLDGPHDVLEGPYGYFTLYEPNGEFGNLLSTLGSPWRITELSHKPFPTGRAAHAMLHAAETLQRKVQFAATDVARIVATVPPLVQRLVDRPAAHNMSVNYARLCLGFLLASLLTKGRIDRASFADDARNDASLIRFASRVEVEVDDSHGREILSPQSIRIELADGRQLERSVPYTPGSPGQPLSEAERRKKFDACVRSANVDPAPLAEALDGLDTNMSARALLELARPGR